MMTDTSRISFQAEDIEFEIKHPDAIRQWLKSIAAAESKALGLIEYIFCSDDFLLDINRTHLNHDYLTDIITFPINTTPIDANVFISIDRVRENAQLYKQSFEDELHRVMAHGLLHLLGYNDKSDEEKQQMRSKEDECLAARSFI